MRTFAIGDIHGHAKTLLMLIHKVEREAAEGDSLVFLGDYIDRGPDSRAVVDYIIKVSARWPGSVTCLEGNHEAVLLDVLRGDSESKQIFLANGGPATIQSYTDSSQLPPIGQYIPREHISFFRNLKPWYEDEHAYYVHAGFTPGLRPEHCKGRDWLWIREEFVDSTDNWGKPVVFGHSPQRRWDDSAGRQIFAPLNRPEKIGIDTGCCYGGPLTAVVMPERRFITAKAR